MEKYKIKIVPRNDGEWRYTAYLYKEKRLPVLFWIKYWALDDISIGFMNIVHAWVGYWKGKYNVVEVIDET